MIAAILKELIAAGLQGESLVAAVERIEQAQPKAIDATAERRRAKDRERYILRRPPKSAETTETTEMKKVSLSSSTSLENSTSKQQESKKERARKSLLSEDWKPKPSHYAKAAKIGMPADLMLMKADDMRNWAKSKAIMRADWDATFHGFLRPREKTNGTHRESLVERADRLIEKAELFERTGGAGPANDADGGVEDRQTIDLGLSEWRSER